MKRSSMMGPTIPMAAHSTTAGDLALKRYGISVLTLHRAQLRLQHCVLPTQSARAEIPGVCEESLQQLVHAVECRA
jgi:hypothetical protein